MSTGNSAFDTAAGPALSGYAQQQADITNKQFMQERADLAAAEMARAAIARRPATGDTSKPYTIQATYKRGR